MASSSVTKASYHARSISLPSRPHPIADQLDEQLCRLRSSQAASSSSSLTSRLNGLTDLYSCVDEFLQLPANQQALNAQGKWAEEVLDGSLRLLDICSTSRDVLLQSKESLQNIQSVLRRRCSAELSIAKDAAEYLNTRKTAKKTIKKCLKIVKAAEENDESNAVLSVLKSVEAITVDTFKYLLSYIAGAKMQSHKSSWSVVAKLIHQRTDKEAAASHSEFDYVDATLASLICQKKKTGIDMSQVENLRNQTVTLESEIQNVDEILECLFRHLVKTRSTLLNIISN